MSQESAQQIITNIIAYSQAHGNLLEKYDLNFYLNHFDRNHLHSLSNTVTPHRPLTQEDFIRLLLLSIPHPEDQTLYLALSLRQLFQAVLERTATASFTVDFSDLTTYLCEKISKDDLDVVVSPRQIVDTSEESRQVCLNSPILVSRVQQEIPKISRELTRRNKKLEEKRSVSKMFFSPKNQQIIALGSLGSTIHLFDLKLNQKSEVRPKECRELDKEVGILSMGYCPSNHRIAAILTSGSLVFWEGNDGFLTQKTIPIKHYGDKVYFLQHINRWATVSSSAVHLWDLREESVTETIACPEAASISDICEVTHLGALCISVVSKTQQKWLIVYQGTKKKAIINLGSAACHTLHYHKPTRSLVPLTYTNSVQVYSITGVDFDPELKYVLRGHKSIITCIDSFQNNTIMVTGDDAGEIRVWELTYMRCLQSLKLTRWLGGIKLIDSHLLYSDSRINLLPLQQFTPPPPEKNLPLYQAYSHSDKALWIFTKKEARKVEMSNGRMSSIIVLCGQEEQISAAVCIGDGFIVGLSNGVVARYNSDAHLTWQKQAHEGEVRELRYDDRNRLIFSLGTEGRIIGWPERNTSLEQERKVINFKRKAINYLRISSNSTILVAGQMLEKELIIWDYEVLSLLEVFEMKQAITAVEISDLMDLMMVATADLKVSFFKYAKKQHSLELIQILTLDLTAGFFKTAESQITTKQHDYINGVILCGLQDLTKHYAMVSTNRGTVNTYDISDVIVNRFNLTEVSEPKESVNILRSQKEEFENSYNQRGHTQYQADIAKHINAQPQVLWSNKIGSDMLSSISALGIGQGVLGILTQEYAKMVDIRTGVIKTSLHVGQPLPIKWSPIANVRVQLKHSLYETLKILDSILRNNGYEMLARQYKQVNVTSFMELMKNCCFVNSVDKREVQPRTSDKPLAISSPHPIEQPTLKTLQTYKRVKAIKKNSQQSMQMPPMSAMQEIQMERDNLLNMLSPDSYCDLIQKYNIQKDPYIKSLNSKLNDSILHKPRTLRAVQKRDAKQQRPKKQDRSSIREATFRDLGNMSTKGLRQMTGLSRSIVMVKDSKQAWISQREEKDIKQILGDLNSKLRRCRLKHARDIEL